MRKKLIALDMDGTLLSTNDMISDVNAQAIKDAQAADHIVMICSGRLQDGVILKLNEIGLSNLPISGGNGAVISVDGEIIERSVMNRESSKKLYEWLDTNEYPFVMCTVQGNYGSDLLFERETYEYSTNASAYKPHATTATNKEEHQKIFKHIIIEDFNDVPENVGILKFYLMTPNKEKKDAAQKFARDVGDLTVTSSFESNIEISDINANKGIGLKRVASYFNIPMEDTVAIGDNYNDSEMFDVAGFAVAMGNAAEGIKKITDAITLSNDENGVAHAITQYVLG